MLPLVEYLQLLILILILILIPREHRISLVLLSRMLSQP